jgi:hypothetical protein
VLEAVQAEPDGSEGTMDSKTDNSVKDVDKHHQLTWDARARRVARQLGIEIGIGEPGDGLTVRLEALEELADRFSHVIDHIERNQ